MPLAESIYWKPDVFTVGANEIFYHGYDIHILRNGQATDDLRNHLFVKNDSGAESRLIDALADTANYGIDKVEFIPSLKGGAAHNGTFPPPASATVLPAGYTDFSIQNVSINTYTGVISATAFLSPTAAYLKNFNFYLTIRITVGTDDHETKVMVHVHDSIVSAWITPPTLTVRALEPDQRMYIYAEFGDGTVGEISYHPCVTWNCTHANVTESATTGLFNTTAPTAANIQMTAALSATFNNHAVTAGTIKIQTKWDDTSPATRPYAKHISGPGKTKCDEVPNVLVIGDGFKSGDKTVFNKTVINAKDKLLNGKTKSPWNHLAKSMNFWALHIPSENRAISVLNDVVPVDIYVKVPEKFETGPGPNPPTFTNAGGVTTIVGNARQTPTGPIKKVTWIEKKVTRWFGLREYIFFTDETLVTPTKLNIAFYEYSVKNPGSKPQFLEDLLGSSVISNRYVDLTTITPLNPSTEITLQKLVELVGLPTQSDEGNSLTTLKSGKWDNLYESTALTITEKVFGFWMKMTDRRLLDETDTALGLAFGKKPRWDDEFVTLMAYERTPSYRRVDRTQLNKLIGNIKNGASPETPIAFVNYWNWAYPNSGKDFQTVLILSNNTRYGGVQIRSNAGSAITIPTVVSGVNRTIAADENIGQGILANLEDDRFLATTSISGRRLKISEFTPNGIVNSTAFSVYSHELAHGYLLDDEYGNKVDNSGVAVPFPGANSISGYNLQKHSDVLTGIDIDGDNIRWRWLRYQKAAVSTLAPDSISSPPNHEITVIKDHEKAFKIGDKVYLRKRLIAEVNASNQLPNSQYSSTELEVLNVDTDNHKIRVSGLLPADATAFGAGSLLVMLVDAKIKGIGKVNINGTTVTVASAAPEDQTYFEVQVNNAGYGGGYIQAGAETHEVLNVTNNGSLTLATAFTAPINNTEYYIIPKDAFAEIINYTVRKTISKNKKPMTLHPCAADPNDKTGEGAQTEVGAQLTVDGVKSVFKLMSSIGATENKKVVGLYSGGAYHYCGIYHPSGSCHMRHGAFTNEAGIVTDSLFCHVCRYVLVDMIDPSKHTNIDSDPNAFFPKI